MMLRLTPDDLADAARASAASSRRCTRCRAVKPRGRFYPRKDRPSGYSSWCKTCVRIGMAEYRATAEYRETLHAYRARPEVASRMRDHDRARDRREEKRATNATARGKVLHCRRQARRKLRAATDPARVARLESLIAAYDRELARTDVRGKELRP